ncbi:hypothetical protein OPT61_g1116 [Boeremia exigua]|uniref:Uncharacterized protein n=1 Tax=Boeremia exigua TaxID=749465 RepID=A0ACC2IRP9_9PLEO|nr:hypothetical protein OPT61_g1116 [Boeremia exigua]
MHTENAEQPPLSLTDTTSHLDNMESSDEGTSYTLPLQNILTEHDAFGASTPRPVPPPYQYQSLSSETDEIRLLRIIKEGTGSAQICLELRHAKLEDNPEFYALSYAWGEDNPDHLVWLSDSHALGLVYVRENLHDFLQEAQKSSDEFTDRWMWIDQICINQINHAERCHQVNQMSKLYATAQRTIIWPGLLFKFEKLPSKEDPLGTGQPMLSREFVDDLLSSDRVELDLGLVRKGELDLTVAICSALSFSWYWKRLWTLQEMILAPGLYVFMSGQLWHYEEVFSLCSIFFDMRGQLLELLPASSHLLPALQYLRNTIDRIRVMRKNLEVVQAGWGLVLGLNQGRDCTVQLDRVYAVMGMLHERLRVYPDYTISPDQLLKCIIRRQLEETHFTNVTIWGIYERLDQLITSWSLDAGFEPVTGAMPKDIGGLARGSMERLEAQKGNVLPTLEKLGILLPTGEPAGEQFNKLVKLNTHTCSRSKRW